MKDIKYICDKCGLEIEYRKDMKRVNKRNLCKKCHKEELKERREKITREILGISKEQELEENRKIKNEYKRKYYKKNKKRNEEEIKNIKIKGAKPRKETKGKLGGLGFYLTKSEKQVLYLKYIKKGLSPERANECIINNIGFLNNVIKKMRKQNKSDEEIKINFKEEFAKLCEMEN